MRALRVALFLHLAPRKMGSIEAWLVALVQRLAQRGHTVTVFVREPVHPDVADAFKRAHASWESFDRVEAQPLRGLLRLRGFDVVHLSFVSALGRLALLAYCAWPTRVLLVDHVSRVDTRRLSGFEGMEPPRTVVQKARRSFLKRVARLRLHRIAAVSDYVRDRAMAELGLKATRVTTIYNGIDVRRFRPGDVPETDREPFTVITVANLIPAKGIDYLLRAVARLRTVSVRLTVVGDGKDRARLETLADDLGISDRTEFLGMRDDVDELLRRSDIFVHPALWDEAFGLTIVEAMASGCPVIASRVGGIPELVEDGVSGLLVPPADEDALQSAIARVINEPSLRRRLSARGRERVVERFGLDECVQAHVDLCERAAGFRAPSLQSSGTSPSLAAGRR